MGPAQVSRNASDGHYSMTIASASRAFGWLSLLLVAMLLLLIGNYLFAERYLLRLDWPRDPFTEIKQHLVPIANPVVLVGGGHGRDAPIAERFLAALGQHPGPLPDQSDSLVPIDYVAHANPYPQPLDVVRGFDISYVSFGYVGVDERYHQVTYYWGESDSTPSFLVRKVRGHETGWGDYFVRYTVFLSMDLKPHPSRWPDIDRVDWSTYEGGSYNGFEEIGFALAATSVEVLGFGVAWRRWVRRLPSNGPLQPSSAA